MNELMVIGWIIWLIVSIRVVFSTVGLEMLVQMFPEGEPKWFLTKQLLSLAFFAAAVLCNPWSW